MATPTRRRRAATTALTALTALGLLAACSGAGGDGGGNSGGKSVNVVMVNNPQMVELQKLTAEHFTKKTGIKVHYTVLPENEVRDKISQDFSNQAAQYDVATISNFEVPFYAKNNWLLPLDDYVAKDAAFDQNDILAPMRESLTAEDGKLYGEPFYGESSFLMYRKDVFTEAGLTMPDKPTWHQVADLAAKADGARSG
ncbi:extracellular solute-binding protein, partial [Streptomyces sp. NPDC051940]|uniref:ABC transporter substrate-binding protein n=1 Tax=Streptomyces sp. NPDC051940 TaxID=3155675 RepID=UPI003446671E